MANSQDENDISFENMNNEYHKEDQKNNMEMIYDQAKWLIEGLLNITEPRYINMWPIASCVIYQFFSSKNIFMSNYTESFLDLFVQTTQSHIQNRKSSLNDLFWVLSNILLMESSVLNLGFLHSNKNIENIQFEILEKSNDNITDTENSNDNQDISENEESIFIKFRIQVERLTSILVKDILKQIKSEFEPIIKEVFFGKNTPLAYSKRHMLSDNYTSPTRMTGCLNKYLKLSQNNFLPKYFVDQIFSYLMEFIKSTVANFVFHHKELCKSSVALEMKFALSLIEKWNETVGYSHLNQKLSLLKQIQNCFLINKSMLLDPEFNLLKNELICPDLTIQQIYYLYENYQRDEFDDTNIDNSFLQNLKKVLSNQINSNSNIFLKSQKMELKVDFTKIKIPNWETLQFPKKILNKIQIVLLLNEIDKKADESTQFQMISAIGSSWIKNAEKNKIEEFNKLLGIPFEKKNEKNVAFDFSFLKVCLDHLEENPKILKKEYKKWGIKGIKEIKEKRFEKINSEKELLNFDENEVVKINNGNKIKNGVKNEVKNEIKNEIKNKIKNEVKNEIKNKIKNEVKNEVKNQIKNKIKNKIKNEVKNQVKNEIKNQVENEIKNEVENQVEKLTALFSKYVEWLKWCLSAKFKEIKQTLRKQGLVQTGNKRALQTRLIMKTLPFPNIKPTKKIDRLMIIGNQSTENKENEPITNKRRIRRKSHKREGHDWENSLVSHENTLNQSPFVSKLTRQEFLRNTFFLEQANMINFPEIHKQRSRINWRFEIDSSQFEKSILFLDDLGDDRARMYLDSFGFADEKILRARLLPFVNEIKIIEGLPQIEQEKIIKAVAKETQEFKRRQDIKRKEESKKKDELKKKHQKKHQNLI
ncbi:myosin-7 [Anaeramoeba ignava]|uniref:Myosin-7 n=1 Tax=Anaeramoeba ignava TaxID=1746090 RepID=A0A9Q0LWU7_ANAIG|nr:myosin-7 [Anaeramoeba ignava]